MALQLMGFQIHLRLEHHKLLVQALFIQAKEVVLLKMIFERIVVDIILLLASTRPSVADVTSFMAIATMSIEFVVSVEPLATESTLGMTSKATLVHGARHIVTMLFMLAQLGRREKLMFVSEDLLVASAKIAKSQTNDKCPAGLSEWRHCFTYHITFPCLLLT